MGCEIINQRHVTLTDLTFDHYSAAMTKSNGSVCLFLKFVTLMFYATLSSSWRLV